MLATNTNTKSKTSKISNPKEYTFEQRKKIEKDCRKMAKRLYDSLHESIPAKFRDALWDFAWLVNPHLITAENTRIELLQTILKSTPDHIKQLKTK